MGIRIGFSSSSRDKISRGLIHFSSSSNDKTIQIPKGNPNPYNFKIIKHRAIGSYLIVWINYPDAKNYEGNKILVYRGWGIEIIKKKKCLDPHFSSIKKFPSPIARFEPTRQGWLNSIRFVKSIVIKKKK
jgi:hypothetical protein